MAYDVPKSAGTEAQRKEFYVKEILRVQPERANDSNLYYGDVELEYLRLVNDGVISPNITSAVVEANLPSRLSDASISTSIQNKLKLERKDYFPRAVIFGTSLEAQNGKLPNETAVIADYPQLGGWVHWMNAYLEQRFDLVRNAGIGGNQYSQMRARLDADVLAYPSEWVFIGGPANDVSQGRTTADIIADAKDIHARILATGRRILQLTVPPSDFYDTAAKKLVVDEVNTWLWSLHQTPGIIVSDAFENTRATGGYGPATGNTTDGVHYSEQGARIIGIEAARNVSAVLPQSAVGIRNSTTKASVIANPTFSTNAGWTAPPAAITATYPGDGRLLLKVTGNTVIADDGISFDELLSNGRYAIGDRLQAKARFKWRNAKNVVDGSGNSTFYPLLRIQQRNADNTFAEEALAFGGSSGGRRPLTKLPTYGEVVVKTQQVLIKDTNFRIYVRVGQYGMASGEIEVSDLQVYKV